MFSGFLLKTSNTDTMTVAAILAFNDKPFESQQVEQGLILGSTLYVLSQWLGFRVPNTIFDAFTCCINVKKLPKCVLYNLSFVISFMAQAVCWFADKRSFSGPIWTRRLSSDSPWDLWLKPSRTTTARPKSSGGRGEVGWVCVKPR